MTLSVLDTSIPVASAANAGEQELRNRVLEAIIRLGIARDELRTVDPATAARCDALALRLLLGVSEASA